MSIQVEIITNTGSLQGVSQTVADMQRKLAELSAQAGNLPPGGVPGDRIVAGSIVAGEIQAGTITAGLIAAGAITSNLIAANTIVAGNIATGTITATQIAAGTITAANIQTATITASQIAAGTITATNIATGTITATQIAAATITGSLIASNTITGGNLVAGTITATQISVSSLSALSANLGTITGGTITGATFQSSGSNPRVVMDSTGVYALDSTGKVTFKADAATGKIITLAGIGGGNKIVNSRADSTAAALWWTSFQSTIAQSSAQRRSGSFSYLVTSTAASGTSYLYREYNDANKIPVVAGQQVTISGWMQGNAQPVGVEARWSNGSINVSPSLATGSSTWQRVSYTFTVPSGVTAMGYSFTFSPTAIGQAIYWTDLQIEEGTIATAYAPKPDEILPSTVTSSMVVDGTLVGADIATATISGGNLIANTITAGQISSSTITSVQIAANTITAGNILAGTITSSKIATGTITAGNIASGTITAAQIAAGTITANLLTISNGGQNKLRNAGFSLWVVGSDSPVDWWHYDNGGATGTATWSKMPLGGPEGALNSWRLVASGCAANKGFQSVVTSVAQNKYYFKPNTTYTYSFWWIGNVQPDIAANIPFLNKRWIQNPTTSTTVWQRYVASVLEPPTNTVSNLDYFYVYPLGVAAGTSVDCQIAQPQLEEGDTVTAWSQYIDPTVIDGGNITAANITSSTITAALVQDIATNPKTAMDSSGVYITAADGSKLFTLNEGTGIKLSAPTGGAFGIGDISWYDTNVTGGTVAEVYGYRGSTAAGYYRMIAYNPANSAYYTQLNLNADSGDLHNNEIGFSVTVPYGFAGTRVSGVLMDSAGWSTFPYFDGRGPRASKISQFGVTIPAGSSGGSFDIALGSATDNVYGIATPSIPGFTPILVNWKVNSNGSATCFFWTYNLSNAGANLDFEISFMCWTA